MPEDKDGGGRGKRWVWLEKNPREGPYSDRDAFYVSIIVNILFVTIALLGKRYSRFYYIIS